MTTFTTEDREEAYKKELEETVPIPFAGWVNTSPPHIVDSGASVMEIDLLRQYVSELEKALESSLALNKAQAERQDK
jgi:hypothetical protein